MWNAINGRKRAGTSSARQDRFPGCLQRMIKARREVVPSVERKLKLPPAQVLVAVCGQLMLKLPAGEATDELMMTPELIEVDPPEFVKLP